MSAVNGKRADFLLYEGVRLDAQHSGRRIGKDNVEAYRRSLPEIPDPLFQATIRNAEKHGIEEHERKSAQERDRLKRSFVNGNSPGTPREQFRERSGNSSEGVPEVFPDGQKPRIYRRPDELGDCPLVPPTVLPGLAWEGCLSLLSADSKTGKTTVMAQAVAAMVKGERFLDTGCGTGRIAIIEEMRPDLLWRWLADHGCKDNTADIDFLPPCSIPDLNDYVDDRRPALIIVDTLVALSTSNKADENSANEMRNLALALQRSGTAALVLHHTMKRDASTYRGSSDIQAAVDMAVTMTRAEGGRRELTYLGRWPQQNIAIDFNAASKEYYIATGALIGRLIHAVHQEPGRTRNHYTKVLQVRRDTAYAAINEAVVTGILTDTEGSLHVN